jgi:hypothetical protein
MPPCTLRTRPHHSRQTRPGRTIRTRQEP